MCKHFRWIGGRLEFTLHTLRRFQILVDVFLANLLQQFIDMQMILMIMIDQRCIQRSGNIDWRQRWLYFEGPYSQLAYSSSREVSQQILTETEESRQDD